MTKATSTRRLTNELDHQTEVARALLEIFAETLQGDDQATFDAIEGQTFFNEAIERVVDRIAVLDTLIASLKAREANFSARRSRFDKQKKTLKKAVAIALDEIGQRNIETATATVYTSAGRQSAMVTDESKLPESFFVEQPIPPPEIDMKCLKDALEQGIVPGATLSNPSTILNIRTR